MERFAITHPMDVNARVGSRGTPLNAALVKKLTLLFGTARI